MLVILSVLLLGPTFVASKIYTADVNTQKQLWEKFKREHNRWYSATEEKYRFANFVQNLKQIDELQSKEIYANDEDTTTFGVNRFADMNQVRAKLNFFPSVYLLSFHISIFHRPNSEKPT
jgi:hypothetical protein